MRKIIQITNAAYQGMGVVALCDDGTVWEIYNPTRDEESEWVKIKDIPQTIFFPLPTGSDVPEEG